MSETNEPNETFATVVKVDDSLGLVFGWAMVSKVDGEDYYDTQGHHIPEDVLLEASADFAERSMVSKEMHAGPHDNRALFVFPLTSEVAKAFGIECKVSGMLYGIRPSAEHLAKFRDGTYKGFSIGGLAHVAYDDPETEES